MGFLFCFCFFSPHIQSKKILKDEDRKIKVLPPTVEWHVPDSGTGSTHVLPYIFIIVPSFLSTRSYSHIHLPIQRRSQPMPFRDSLVYIT